jgi:hypothetical protein
MRALVETLRPNRTATSTAQCIYSSASGAGFRETGIFLDSAGGFWEFSAQEFERRPPETIGDEKSPPLAAFLLLTILREPSQKMAPVQCRKSRLAVNGSAAIYIIYSYFTRILASFRAKVRRCIPRRRAASEMLKSECTKTSWMCSHSRFLIDVGRLESSTEASPSAR